MQKTILPLFIFISLQTAAQNVGIGNTAPSNKLHVTASANPLRLEGLQSGAGTDSLLTVDATGVVRRRINNVTAWSLSGNAGTSAVSNFLGTTDYTSFSIRTNNQRSAFIDADSTRRNNSLGSKSLNVITSGIGNNAIGFVALSNVSTGSSNVAMGDSAAFNITTGINNISLGTDALLAAISSSGNVAIGTNALRNTISSENIAIGNNAAAANFVASNVLAIGANSLKNNQASFTQMAIGNNALLNINGGIENIGIGFNSGLSLTSSNYNVLLGHYALSSTTGASNNTIIGHNAGLAYTATGSTNNTFIGYQAGFSQIGGTGNTYVGASVDLPGNTTLSNSSALGQGVSITASNQVRIGNTSITSIGGQVGWTTFSDARIKEDIKEDVPGLNFINRLRPVSYHYNISALHKIQGNKAAISDDAAVFETIKFTGLIAQEVEAASNLIHYNFSGVDKPTNEQTPYGLRYAEFVVPLIKAVQEMKILIDTQQKQIDELKKKL